MSPGPACSVAASVATTTPGGGGGGGGGEGGGVCYISRVIGFI